MTETEAGKTPLEAKREQPSLTDQVVRSFHDRYATHFKGNEAGFAEMVNSATNTVSVVGKEPRFVPDLLFHGTIEPILNQIKQQGKFNATIGRSNLAISPSYPLNYATLSSESHLYWTPELVAGQVDKSLNHLGQLQQAIELMSTDENNERYGRIVVFSAQKLRKQGFETARPTTGTDSVETLGLYQKGPDGNTDFSKISPLDNPKKVSLPFTPVVEAIITNTPLFRKLVVSMEDSLEKMDIKEFAESERAMMLYFALAKEDCVELVANQTQDTALAMRQRTETGRQVALSVVSERMRTISRNLVTSANLSEAERDSAIKYHGAAGIRRDNRFLIREIESVETKNRFVTEIPGMEPLSRSINIRIERAKGMLESRKQFLEEMLEPTGKISPETHRKIQQTPKGMQAVIDAKGRFIGYTRVRSN